MAPSAVRRKIAPRRSFDLRAQRLFDQLDPEEQKVVAGVKAVADKKASTAFPLKVR